MEYSSPNSEHFGFEIKKLFACRGWEPVYSTQANSMNYNGISI